MKKALGYLLVGGIAGYSGHYFHNFLTPQRTIPASTRDLIDNFVSERQLEQAYMLTIMKGLGVIGRAFYHYGMDDKLGGFNYNNIYIPKNEDQQHVKHLYCIFSPTDYICGHPEIQHGGATATIIDQNMGYLASLYSHELVATAKLNVEYKRPIRKNQYYVLEVEIQNREERRIYLKGKVRDLETGEVKVLSDALFMTVNWDHKMGRIIKSIYSKVYKDDKPVV